MCDIASMSSRFEVTDSAPETAPQSSVAPKSLSGLHGRNASSANQTLPATATKSPRDRSFLANSLKTKSFSAAKNRQQNA